MFICHENKLFIRKGNKIVGVDFGADGVVEVEGTELIFSPHMLPIEAFEAKSKFNVTVDTPYSFPLSKTKTLSVEEKDTEPILEPKQAPKKVTPSKQVKKK